MTRLSIRASFRHRHSNSSMSTSTVLISHTQKRLANGAKIEFSDKGVWEEVDCQFSEVPAAIIPVAIKNYIDENFAGEKVISIERNRFNYEVKLSNRLELKFDKDFNIYDIDD